MRTGPLRRTLAPALVAAAFVAGIAIGAHSHAQVAAWIPALAAHGDCEVDAVRWICPTHAEIVRKEPGNCPVCGKSLAPKGREPEEQGGEESPPCGRCR